MNLLSIIQYSAEGLIGTQYEGAVNFVLFCLLLVAVSGAMKLMIGANALEVIWKSGFRLMDHAERQAAYAPEWEKRRARLEPYISLPFYLLCAIVSGLWGILGVLSVVVLSSGALAWPAFVGLLWFMVCAAYLRFSLAAASRAHARLKRRQSDG